MVDDPLEATGRAPGSGGAAPALPLTSRQDASLQTDGSAAPAVEVELAISGMTCASCVARVEKKLGKLPGVTAVVNLATEKARVELSPQAEDVEDSTLVGTVVKAGYGATVLRRIRVGADGQREVSAGVDAADAEAAAARASVARVADLRRRFLVSLALSAPIVAVSMTPAWQFSGWQWILGALSVPVALWCAWPFHRAAWRAGRHGSTTMDTLVSLGIVASMGWSLWALLLGGAGEFGYTMRMTGIHGLGHADRPHLYFETAAMIVTFLLLGRWLEARSRRSAGDALRSLLALGAQEATRVRRADGTAVARAGEVTFRIASELVDDVVSVPEGALCTEMLELYQVEGIIAEPAGALASTAVARFLPDLPDGPIACVVSGGNNDVSRYDDIVERSSVYEGLRHYFLVTFPQEPGALRHFLDGVLTDGEDIVLFEYTKKNNRETGPALVGIEIQDRARIGDLLTRMEASPLHIEKLEPDSPVFSFLL